MMADSQQDAQQAAYVAKEKSKLTDLLNKTRELSSKLLPYNKAPCKKDEVAKQVKNGKQQE